jgi:hypothetical protein
MNVDCTGVKGERKNMQEWKKQKTKERKNK